MSATPKMLAALERARAARAAKVKERGSYLTPEGMAKQRELGRRNVAAWEGARAHRAGQEKPIGDDADTMVWQLFRLMHESGRTHRDICRAAGISEKQLREWRLGGSMPLLETFRRVAWACGYVLKLEKREERPRDRSIWPAPRATFIEGR